MPLSKDRVRYLIKAYILKQANADEENELMDWLLNAEEDSELKNYVLDIWNQYKPSEDLSYVDWDQIYSRVMQSPVVAIRQRRRWVGLTAAAAVLILLVSGGYLYFTSSPSSRSMSTLAPNHTDILPPSDNKATLTLANGTKIDIGSSNNGTIALQGNVTIIKQSNGEICYAGASAGEVTYNTLSVPKGSKPLNLMLSDSTRVWLNVGSDLTYPTAFTGKERKVKVSGEAYFEVAHNARMPFNVQHGDVTVNVLGTHFNVNTYEDEPAERITLLEGSVRVNKNAFTQSLQPGQQAIVSYNEMNDIKVLNDVNVQEVMAWKNGKFSFGTNTDINTIMRQISRWYDVDVEYKGEFNRRFWGSISKDVNLLQVLKILEATGDIKFKVEGRKIIVMSGSP